jgi:hypothetical protein
MLSAAEDILDKQQHKNTTNEESCEVKLLLLEGNN